MQQPSARSLFRIEGNYACVQSSYWVSYCTLSAFTTVYLTYRGLTNTQIGLTSSLMSFLAIFLQAGISSFCDHHLSMPIKRIISVIFLVGIGFCGLYSLVPMPIGLLVLTYSAAYVCSNSNYGLLNAQLMQFNNVGIPARYGWPRGCASLLYAIACWLFGMLAETYTPAILPRIYMLGTLVCILCVLLMPDPYRGLDLKAILGNTKTTTYRAMLTGNPTLVVFLSAVILYSVGQAAGFTFMIRVVERLGGGTAEYGVSEFARAGVEMPMLFLSPLLLRRFSAKSLVAVAYFFQGLKIVCIILAPSLGWLYAASMLNAFSAGIFVSAVVVLANSLVRLTEKVRAQSLVSLCGCVGSILGNAYAGWMLDAVGLVPMMISASVFCFLSCAVLALFCHPARQA